MGEPMEEPAAATPRLDLEQVARVTIPLHFALPWILWGLAWVGPSAPVMLFMALHVLFPVLAVVTYRYWKGQGFDLLLLIVVNHVVTLISGALAGLVASLV